MTDADAGLRPLADGLTDRYGTGKTIVDRVGDICVSIYCGDYHADVFFSELDDAYALDLCRKGYPVYTSWDGGGNPYDLTYDDLIKKLDEYFPRVKAKQMEMEI